MAAPGGRLRRRVQAVRRTKSADAAELLGVVARSATYEHPVGGARPATDHGSLLVIGFDPAGRGCRRGLPRDVSIAQAAARRPPPAGPHRESTASSVTPPPRA